MKTINRLSATLLATTLGAATCATLLSGCERPPMHSVQEGYRGLGLVQVSDPRLVTAAQIARNKVPAALPQVPATPGGPLAGDTFKNVQVLKDLPVGDFARLMAAVTTWVAPTQGCTYCHAADLSSDALYTKVVARRMFQMTRHINADWQKHVAGTGVTCFSCHRGHNVPEQIWYTDVSAAHASAYAGNKAGQNAPSPVVRMSSLPNDPFTTFLESPREIRVISEVALRQDGMGTSIKQVEQTYGLMMHFTQALGVNCTYCHNSRSFFDWDQSTPQRAVAWYGIRMVRELNTHFLEPLQPTFPVTRRGPGGDAPKLNCATCHQGAFKPLNGVSMLKDYPELSGAR
jgi:photosynthetic reaction center cytochrome c subunit